MHLSARGLALPRGGKRRAKPSSAKHYTQIHNGKHGIVSVATYHPSPPGLSLREKKWFVTLTETDVHGDALRFMVKTWARHKTTETVC